METAFPDVIVTDNLADFPPAALPVPEDPGLR
jgi:hypothetical protein